MSQHGQYEIEGRVGGPFTVVQLQLMAASGMLQPHDRIRRKKSEEWYNAGSIRELFGPAPLVPTSAPRTTHTEPSPTNGTSQPIPNESANEEIRAAFDFFSTPVPPVPAPKPKDKPAPPKPVAAAFELPRSPEQVSVTPSAAEENPFDFRLEPAGAPRQHTKNNDDVTVLMDVRELVTKPTAPEQTAAARTQSAPTGKKTELMLETKTAGKQEQIPAPKTEDGEKTKIESRAAGAGATGAAVPSTRAEVSGHAIELTGDGSARPMDGKSVFRLYRSWLLFATKFSDETSRAVYLRLQQIDAGIIEQRPSAAHFKGGPYNVLTISAGQVQASLAFQGSDKPYRAFLEKVLAQCNAAGSHSSSSKS